MRKGKILEKVYRASRIARVIGNPTAFAIVDILLKEESLRPRDIANKLNLSLTTISHTLRMLRNIDLVRYKVGMRETYYFIKYENETRELINSFEKIVERTIKRVDKDY